MNFERAKFMFMEFSQTFESEADRCEFFQWVKEEVASVHFFLEQLVGEEGWRECVEVTTVTITTEFTEFKV